MKKMLFPLFTGILLTVVLMVCGGAPKGGRGAKSFEAAVTKIWDSYSAAILAGDADRWITLWDEKGIQMPPDNPMVYGKATIYARIKAGFAAVTYDKFVIDLEEATPSGSFGFARGTYAFFFTPKAGGEKVSREGKYLTILKHEADGSWKLYRDCFNFNAPAQ